MASGKEIKNRIKSVKNTKKITKAMELVAASKMKRAVSATLSSRLYAEYSWNVLSSIAKNIKDIKHPLFTERDATNGQKDILLVLITSNRGLCGAYNSQVLKKTVKMLQKASDSTQKMNVSVVTVGKRGDNAMRRMGQEIVATFSELPDTIKLRDIVPISEFLLREYNANKYHKILIAYTDFVSALSQKPNIKQILPVSRETLKEFIDEVGENEKVVTKEDTTNNDYTFEGEKELLIGSLAQKISRMQIYQMLLESRASEESSRMIAMKNASDAAGEMIEDLTLVFNKARQAGITQEISEISAGMASVS